MKRSDNFSDTTFFKYDFPLRLKNFSQKYLKSIFFNIGGITYRSPGHFAVFHEKIRQVFSYLEIYRRSRRRTVYYSAFNTARVRRDLLYQCCTSVDLTVMSRRRRLYTTVYYCRLWLDDFDGLLHYTTVDYESTTLTVYTYLIHRRSLKMGWN